MEKNMRGGSKMELLRDWENIFIKMEMFMKENLGMGLKKEMEK
jgi:hypothetical protein